MNEKKFRELLIERGYTPAIATDLDGTLAEWHGWNDPIGKPVIKMLTRVYKWRADGKRVVLFTARIADKNGKQRADQIKLIREWLEPLGLEDIEITNMKTSDIYEFWDDRAIGVERNSGERVDGKYSRE